MSEHEEDVHEEEQDGAIDEALESALELDTQSRIFLQMREQNIHLLKIAAEVAGLAGQHPPLKSNDLKGAIRSIWDIYSEFYAWVDPEESEDDDDEDEEE